MQANRKVIGSSRVLLVAALLTGGSASGQDVGGGLRLSAPGLEPESVITERFGIRALANSGTISYDYDRSGIRYDGLYRIGTSFLLADWHPYATGFRLSGGLAYNNQRVVGAVRPGTGTISIDGTRYSSAQLGALATFSRAAPYVGVGWGLTPRPGSRLYFSADLGVTYQRLSSLTGSCGAALPAAVCAQMQNDLRAEDPEHRDAADDVRFNPVISVGFGLRF
ncbi:MAG: hypothetical protein ACXW14_09520 [Burkholderiaceae bacterium]